MGNIEIYCDIYLFIIGWGVYGGLVMLAAVFLALEKGLSIWDYYNKTSYAKELRELIMVIAKEEAKPIYHEDSEIDSKPHLLRDQSKIDDAHLKILALSRKFVDDEKGMPSGS